MAEVVPGGAAHCQATFRRAFFGLHARGEGVHVEGHACLTGQGGRVGIDEALLVEDVQPRVHGAPALDGLGVLGLPGMQPLHEGGIEAHGGQEGPGHEGVSVADP